MQVSPDGFTAEQRDSVRSITHNLQISWKKDTNLSATTFAIGVSTIGGDDLIGINPGAIGSPSNYLYFDESDYVMSLSWERGLNMPTGGLTKAQGEALLDNTSSRFLPHYMGGNSELFTAILPRRPFVINAGFNYGGIDQTLAQFVGATDKRVRIDSRSRTVSLNGTDYLDFFQNRYLDQVSMFTATRSDVIIEDMLSRLGMSTAQYTLDTGINIVPFGLFDKGTKFADIIGELVEAENGHFYQDEQGKFRFENRQHWDSSPYNQVQKIIYTSQVINAGAPSDSHLINVVEVSSPLYQKQPMNTLFTLPIGAPIEVPGNTSIDKFFEFNDPVLELTNPSNGGADSFYFANTESDATGSDRTSSITFTNIGTFAKVAKYRITNTSSSAVFITQLQISGRVAKNVGNIYHREQNDSSVTAYEERILTVNNDYIQNQDWAKSYARMILNDYSEPENIQNLTIRAMPDLQLGDLVSWQGRYWRVYDIKSTLTPSGGFVQELTMLKRTINAYFRIGISNIGGTDQIAP